MFLDEDTEVQPDACLFRLAPAWRARLVESEGESGAVYVEGTPDFVVEVAASSASYDLHDKMEAYRRAGVPECVVWQIYERRIDWFRLQDGAYVRVEPDDGGIIESAVFPGLRLAVAKILAGDDAGVIAALGTA